MADLIQRQFVSAEMEDCHAQLRGLSHLQKQCEANLSAKLAEAVLNGFQQRTTDELAELDREDERLSLESLRLFTTYVEASLAERRRQIGLAAHKAGKTAVLPSISSQPRSLVTVVHNTSGSNNLIRSTLSAAADAAGGEAGLSHDILTWELTRDEIRMENVTLGKGAFGTVTKGVLRGKSVAVKTLPIVWGRDGSLNDRGAAVLNDFRNECAVMSKLLHPNVLLLMGVCIDQEAGELLMVTELMENGSVFDLLHRRTAKMPFKQRMRIARDCVLGMNYLHLNKPQPILHLDLKTANLLVNAGYLTKVADFGMSKVYGLKETKAVGGTPFYMSPEILNEQAPDAKADVYAFGIILWELVAMKVPYTDEKFRTDALGLAQLYCHVVEEGKRPKIPADCPPKLAELIDRCWAGDPAQRPTFQEILDSRLLDEIVLDDAISEVNALGRSFWKESFVHQKELLLAVDWPTFARALASWCNIRVIDAERDKDISWKALHMVLLPENETRVTLERFSAVLEWFGPFAKGDKLLQSVFKTIKIKGFYGDMASDQMGNLLAGKPIGSYVIRFSGQQPGFFTITTLSSKDNIQSFRINHRPGKGYWLKEDKVFPTLKMLVLAYKPEIGLKTPLLGSKYQQLLVEFKEGERTSVYAGIAGPPRPNTPTEARTEARASGNLTASAPPAPQTAPAASGNSKKADKKEKKEKKEKEKKDKKEKSLGFLQRRRHTSDRN